MDKSILMQKQVKDNSEDLQKEYLDLKNWEEEMRHKDEELRKEISDQITIPPIRTKTKKKTKTAPTNGNENDNKTKRIKSYDYSAWDKFDVDSACKEINKEDQSDDSGDEVIPTEELEKAHEVATKHKNEGNIFVQQQKWVKAIECYNQAIKAFPYDAVFYANRALCQLKLDNLHSAESDCSAAIQLDQTYVKAYHRRATARMNLKQYKEAKEDLEKVLKLEPSNKEAKSLLTQVEKKMKSSKSVSVKEDTQKLPKMSSAEKKVEEKICSDNAVNIQTLDSKNAKDTKNTKKDEKVEKAVKDTTIKKKEKDRRIPDWLPEKHNVTVIEPIEKPPHLRSKKPLTRIPVEEANFTSIKENIVYNDEITCNKREPTQLKESDENEKNKKSNDIKASKSVESFSNILPIPKTAVQFMTNWKSNKSLEFRYKYLKQLPEKSLPKIFKDSMESDIFSQILQVLRIEFIQRKDPTFCYLRDLSQVKRFRALIMFISNDDKESLRILFDHCKTVEQIAQEGLTDLKHKYEI